MDNDGNQIAADYITQLMESYGYKVEKRNPYWDCINLISTKKGKRFPDKYFLIGAHYDTALRGKISPGADDNASGTAAVLEAARILRNLETSYSIIF